MPLSASARTFRFTAASIGTVRLRLAARRLAMPPAPAIAALNALACLLNAPPTPTSLNAMTCAVRDLMGAEDAWLLTPHEDDWAIVGHAMGRELPEALALDPPRVMPLYAGPDLVGAVALWPPDNQHHPFTEAFLPALAAAMHARDELDHSRRLALTDALTDLPNRRAFDDALGRMIALTRRTGRPLCLLMLDLDRFKRVNDAHGHEVGDRVLVAVGAALRTRLRASDMPARYGGEEFAVILPGSDLAGAQDVAESLRRAIDAVRVEAGDATLHPTVSIGVAMLTETDTPESLSRRADEALYRAKADGRSCVRTAPEDIPHDR